MKDFFEVQDLPLSEDFFETGALKEAVWQYVLDHSKPSVGSLRVHMFVRDADDFWRRVNARKYHRYTREDARKLTYASMGRHKEYVSLKIGQAKGDKKQRDFDSLRNGHLSQRIRYHLALFLRKLANSLIKEGA